MNDGKRVISRSVVKRLEAQGVKKLEYTASPSELVLADDCAYAHSLRYQRRLRLREEKRSPTMASGSAVHYAVERALWEMDGTPPTGERLADLGIEGLTNEFVDYEFDERMKLLKRFGPGVKRAIAKIPSWMWEGQWEVEKEVKGRFEADDLIVNVKGRLDMMRFVDEPVPTIELIDVKTTETDPLQFILWTPQLRIYAACLSQMYPERLIVYRYVCVPTTASATARAGAEVIFTKGAAEKASAEILRYGRKLVHDAEPRYARRCQWCSYAPICIQTITGGDPEGLISELYYEKEGHDGDNVGEGQPVGADG